MLNPRWKRIINTEILFICLGLFIILGIVESITPYVVIRNTPEFFLLIYYYFLFYFLVLTVRFLFWVIGNFVDSSLPQYNSRVESEAENNLRCNILKTHFTKNIRIYK